MLNDEVLTRIAANYDETQLLDVLDITIEDLVLLLSDQIEDNISAFEDVL